MSLIQVSLILSQGHQGTSQRGQHLLLAMKHWMGSMGLGPAWQSKDVISFCIPRAILLITHIAMYVTSIQAPLSLLPQSHPDCQTTQHPSHVCLTMLMLTMYGQENLFNSVSLVISPHPSPISPSSYFIWESPIPELSVFTLHYSDGLPFTLSCLQFPV